MPRRRPEDGGQPPGSPPSAAARADLAQAVKSQVAEARVRLQEITLRAEAHRLLGDDTAAAAALAEQDRVLQDLRTGLGHAVSAGVVQREAERVVHAATSTEPAAAREHVRVPALSGVASVIAVLALAAAAVVGIDRGPDRLDGIGVADVGEAASDRAPSDAASGIPGPSNLALQPGAPEADSPVTPPSDLAPTPTLDPGSVEPAESVTPPAPEQDEPVPSDLEEVTQDLLDAVDGLGPDEGDGGIPDDEESELDDVVPDDPSETESDGGSEVDASVPDDLAPADDDDGDDDGIVPGVDGQ